MKDDAFLTHTPGEQAALDSLCAAQYKRVLWILASLVIHAITLLIVCWPATPAYIKPVWVARGQGGGATPVFILLYMPRDFHSAENALLSLPSASHPTRRVNSKLRKRHNILQKQEQADLREAGNAIGSDLDGMAAGDEVKPGFAIHFTAPLVSRSELPGGVPGDVAVELTIDTEGNVVDEKLLQGLGPVINERVIATLRDWHFQPATRNGVAIPFKYDAHFHFPT